MILIELARLKVTEISLTTQQFIKNITLLLTQNQNLSNRTNKDVLTNFHAAITVRALQLAQLQQMYSRKE